jgi:predicted nucleic acid-binding protein
VGRGEQRSARRWLRILYTYVTWDELLEVEDEGRRAALLEALNEVGERVPVAEWVLDASPLGEFRLGSGGPDFEALRAGDNTSDALISITARFEGCRVVTHDKRMRGRAERAGIPVCDMAELCRDLGGK